MPKFHTILEIFEKNCIALWPTFKVTIKHDLKRRLYSYVAAFPLPNGISATPYDLKKSSSEPLKRPL